MNRFVAAALSAALLGLIGCASAPRDVVTRPAPATQTARIPAPPPTAPEGADASLVKRATLLRAEDRRVLDEGAGRLADDPDPSIRARAARVLWRIGTADARERLERALVDPDAAVRAEAAFGLGEIGDAKSRAVLVSAAGDAVPQVRARVAEALGRTASAAADAGAAVVRLIDDNDPEVRTEACLAAWKLRDAGVAVDPLIRRMTDAAPAVRLGAAYALARLGSAASAPPSSGAQAGRLGGAALGKVRVALADAARAPEPEIRMQAARGLANPSTPAEESVIGVLAADPDPGVRINAMRSLAFPGMKIDKLIVPRLRDANPHVLRAAVEALGKVGGNDAANLLWNGLTKSRDKKAWALEPSATGFVRCVPDQALRIADRLVADEDPTMRAAAGVVLADRTEPEAFAIAQSLLSDREPRVVAALVPIAARAPGKLSDTIGAAITSADPVPRAAAAEAAGARLADPTRPEGERDDALVVLQRLWDASRDDTLPDARVEILSAAGKAGRSVGGRALLDAGLVHPDRATRVRAAAVLAEVWREDASSRIGPASDEPLDRYVEMLRWGAKPHAAIVTVQREGFAPGRFTIALDAGTAPLAAWNFAQLAAKGFYDGLVIHRVVPNFVVQDGDPRGDGWGGPGYSIRDEFSPGHFWAGAVGMASDGRDSAGSQWFVTLAAQPHLDGRYTIFGRVVQNLEGVVGRTLPGDRVLSIRIYEGDGAEPLPPLGTGSPAR